MADINANEFSSVKCVFERFHIEKFRETQLEAIKLLQGKDVLVLQPTGSGKSLIFSAECTIGMVWGLTALKHYGNKAQWHMALWHYGTKV